MLTPAFQRGGVVTTVVKQLGVPPLLQPFPSIFQVLLMALSTIATILVCKTSTDAPILCQHIITRLPTSHIPLRKFDVGQLDSAGSLGSKPDSVSPLRPDSKLDTHVSTDAVCPPRSADRPTFMSPIREGPGVECGSGLPTPSLSSRFQGVIQRKDLWAAHPTPSPS